MDKDTQYWKNRCELVERRNGQLVKEIYRLRGYKPLSKEFIGEHNRKCEKNGVTD
jgi:hypothetical protein